MYIQIFWSHTVALCEKPYWNWIIPEIISPISEQDQPVSWSVWRFFESFLKVLKNMQV